MRAALILISALPHDGREAETIGAVNLMGRSIAFLCWRIRIGSAICILAVPAWPLHEWIAASGGSMISVVAAGRERGGRVSENVRCGENAASLVLAFGMVNAVHWAGPPVG